MKENIPYKKIHFIGIGGVSMSGIAQILLKWGYIITGSDRNDSEVLQILKNAGATIYIGHNGNNVQDQDLIVYTAAISKDNPEIVKGNELGIKIMERAEFLGELTKLYPKTIAISGTHGKTTTSSMISLCFLEANLDPSIQVGSVIPQISKNYKVGNSPYFIIEACEYVNSFLHFCPQTEIILNIEADHLDFFKDIDDIYNSFKKFTDILPTNGNLVINLDNEYCQQLVKNVKSNINVLTYSLENENADLYAFNIQFDEKGYSSFNIKYQNDIFKNIKLNVIGIHNVSNACACILTCLAHNIDLENIKEGLEKFTGSQRRFEYKGKSKSGADIYDDYAHHPTEIKALLNACSNKQHEKIFAIFQPHTYSRTKTLFEEFARCFDKCDIAIITDIYAAREIDNGTISSKMLVDKINELYPKKAIYISSFENIEKYINEKSSKNDIVLTIGAGNITNISTLLM